MDDIVNRYGIQSVSQLLSRQFESRMEACDRAGNFLGKAIENIYNIREIELIVVARFEME